MFLSQNSQYRPLNPSLQPKHSHRTHSSSRQNHQGSKSIANKPPKWPPPALPTVVKMAPGKWPRAPTTTNTGKERWAHRAVQCSMISRVLWMWRGKRKKRSSWTIKKWTLRSDWSKGRRAWSPFRSAWWSFTTWSTRLSAWTSSSRSKPSNALSSWQFNSHGPHLRVSR